MAPNNYNKKFCTDILPVHHNALLIDSNYDLSKLPEEVLRIIFQFLNFDTVANIRLVCQKFNVICQSMLTLEFKKLSNKVNKRYQLASKMPRQVPLSCKRQVIIYLNEELLKLHLLLGKHLSDGCCCFFAGKILDELNVALRKTDTIQDKLEVVSINCLPKAFKVLNKYFTLYRKLYDFIQSFEHFDSENEIED